MTPKGDSAEALATGDAKARLGAGQLRDMVLVHLREHSDQDYAPSVLGKVLARSSCAIANIYVGQTAQSLAHIPDWPAPQRELRMVYWSMRMASLGRKR